MCTLTGVTGKAGHGLESIHRKLHFVKDVREAERKQASSGPASALVCSRLEKMWTRPPIRKLKPIITGKHDNMGEEGWRSWTRDQTLAAKAKDALDVAGEATFALLLHLLIQRWEGHVVQSQIKEEGLAGDRLELWRKGHQAGLLPNQAGVQAKRIQAAAERLHETKGCQATGRRRAAG